EISAAGNAAGDFQDIVAVHGTENAAVPADAPVSTRRNLATQAPFPGAGHDLFQRRIGHEEARHRAGYLGIGT
ncbi:hypothetical protein GY972_24005, partial [Escherichia coli]|uniref:hypothetical protein n=1 Tax=Escherichia coli TaxID=562 RepID=UPI0015C4618F